MTHTEGDKPAFPYYAEISGKEMIGMTMREWYAGMALKGILANQTWCGEGMRGLTPDQIARLAALNAFGYADAMLAESKRLHEEMLQKLKGVRDAQVGDWIEDKA